MSGRSAASSASAAALTAPGSGAVRRAGKTPSAGSAWISASSTGCFWTSNGRPIWAAPGRPVVMWRNAARTAGGIWPAWLEHPVPLGQRPEQRLLVELGQHVAATRGDRDVGGEREHRDRGLVGLDHARQEVGGAAARGPLAHPDPARDARIGVRHVGGRALVAGQDVADAVVEAAERVVERQARVAAQPEHVTHAVQLQHAHQRLRPGQLVHQGLPPRAAKLARRAPMAQTPRRGRAWHAALRRCWSATRPAPDRSRLLSRMAIRLDVASGRWNSTLTVLFTELVGSARSVNLRRPSSRARKRKSWLPCPNRQTDPSVWSRPWRVVPADAGLETVAGIVSRGPCASEP